MEYKIKIKEEGSLISELLQENKIDFTLPCSGRNICGKCKIRVKGDLSAMSPKERSFFREDEIKAGYRLACFTRAYSDIEVALDRTEDSLIAEEGIVLSSNFDPILGEDEYGIVVDIGTTTMAMQLLKGDRALAVSKLSQINDQKIYGADVISRIDYSIKHSVQEIQKLTIGQLNKMINMIMKNIEVDIESKNVNYLVITGNTVMLHFVEGLDPAGIATAPFTPESHFGYYLDNELGLDISKDGKIYLPPAVSGYVGADLMTGILASGMMDNQGNSLIVDIGTNGEMALLKDDQLIACSTAAGPAFEGVGTKHGVSSIAGAINKVYYDEKLKKIVYETISNQPPIGICGSGIVDTISVLLDVGVIDKTGRVVEEGHDFEASIVKVDDHLSYKFDDCHIVFTQKDVRQVQLAKASIAAGIEVLLEEGQLDIKNLDNFYISGGFGSFIRIDSAENIGLLPAGSKNPPIALGNGALAGANLILLDKASIGKLEATAERCNYIELSASSLFMEKYIDKMTF